MRIETLREVKTNLSQIVNGLADEHSLVITKNGRPCAVMFPVTEDTDLESFLLAHNPEFWRMFDAAHAEGEKKGFTPFEELPD